MARKWESIICYEDRAELTTSRWRLAGIKTKEGGQNTDDGVLWFDAVKSGSDVTATLKDAASGGSIVASGTADVSGCDGTGENAVELELSEYDGSGISGSFWIHEYNQDPTNRVPVQIALCVDEDVDAIWDDIENLPGYDSTYGLAEHIRVAGEDVIGQVMAIYREALGGYGAAEAWYIRDAERSYPDLRRLANPGQLRLAAAWHTLEIALGAAHTRASPTMYSELRDYFRSRYEEAMRSLVLAIKSGSGDNATSAATAVGRRLSRV